MELLGLEATLNRQAEVNEMRWYEHVLVDNDDVLRTVLDFEKVGRRAHG